MLEGLLEKVVAVKLAPGDYASFRAATKPRRFPEI